MPIDDVQLWILELVAMRLDLGVSEDSIEATTLNFYPDVEPLLEQELTLLSERGLLEVKSDITIGEKGSTRVDRYFITDLGRDEIAAALALRIWAL